jgi:hypothetical protein
MDRGDGRRALGSVSAKLELDGLHIVGVVPRAQERMAHAELRDQEEQGRLPCGLKEVARFRLLGSCGSGRGDSVANSRGAWIMAKSYIAIAAIIFALVAIVHLVRIVQGWQVQLGDVGVAMSVSWAALVVSAALAVWGAVLLRR